MIGPRTHVLAALMLAPLILAGGLEPAKAVTRGAVCNELARSCLRQCDDAETEKAATQCKTTCYTARDACNVGNGASRNYKPTGSPPTGKTGITTPGLPTGLQNGGARLPPQGPTPSSGAPDKPSGGGTRH